MRALILCSALSMTAAVAAAQDVTVDEWEVPYAASRPRDPYVTPTPDGRVWFVGQRSHYVASLDPETGTFARYDLADGTGPHNLVVDSDGTIWYTGNRVGNIGHLDPATGHVDVYTMPDERARDPHTLVFDHDGNLWFTVQGGNMVGHLDKATGAVRLVEAPRVSGGRRTSSRPYGIKIDSHGRPWVALFGTNRIATVDPATMTMRTFPLPDGARPRRLVIDSHDIVWYGDYARGFLGRLDPADGTVKEWRMPGGEGALPYGLAIDAADRIWFVETGLRPNRFVGFDPATGTFTAETPIVSGGGSVRHMFYDARTNVVWFGTDANTIGRATLPPVRRDVS